jgi:LCP family protein required for cell wall assembly
LLKASVLVIVFAVVVTASAYYLLNWITNQPRTNVLVMGIDRRPNEGTVVRSDTMMLVTAYPPDPAMALLSIPRDLYVDIPGYGSDRINTAHFWGENEGEGNGLDLAMETVALNFRVPVHHYVRVDFDGFRAVIDAVGGIDITVEEAIVDEEYPTEDYGTIRIEIPAGDHHMDGETALRYARSRHGSSDFDRAARQQQVLAALAQRMLLPEIWPSLPNVYLVIRAHVDTDLTAADMIVLAAAVARIGPEGIGLHMIDQEMTQPWTTPSGGAVLLPRWELINPLVQDLFTP